MQPDRNRSPPKTGSGMLVGDAVTPAQKSPFAQSPWRKHILAQRFPCAAETCTHVVPTSQKSLTYPEKPNGAHGSPSGMGDAMSGVHTSRPLPSGSVAIAQCSPG